MRRTRMLIAAPIAVLVLSTVTVATAGFDIPPGDALVHRASSQPLVLADSFTYQGRLTESGGPANGVYDLRFILYDAESGGSQVGSTVASADVNVVGGLFTVSLDFGAGAFDGNARWLEIAVRPGASTGIHTVLSPRQAIGSTPYALYAKASGGIAVPFTASGSAAGDLFAVTQSGDGAGLTVNRVPFVAPTPTTSPSPSVTPTATPIPAAAIRGTNAGPGAGVVGETTNASGIGGSFSGNGAGTGSALEIRNGGIKVGGTLVPAFVHTTTSGTIAAASDCGSAQCSQVSHPLLDGNPSAIVIVTYAQPGVTNPHPVGVSYANGFWRIFNADTASMPAGAKFNVLVITQ